MTVKEIKETVETVVRTDYIAEDGTVFHSEEACKEYEGSALYAVTSQLKCLNRRMVTSEDVFPDGGCYGCIEVFNVETSNDLTLLKQYVQLTMKQNCATDKEVEWCMSGGGYDRMENTVSLKNLTYGHPVILFWSEDMDSCWACGDGSFAAMIAWIQDRFKRVFDLPEECGLNG